ncbi:hypothetical protein DFH07DRAFT_766816 [Mycena maculata]|uniref:Uncharacterized protein n=1 Tax=Mycena maculata TaxID=230809 RepID=A0AAD7K211_9AGAR|nr:hypothetical protein DFH07DRAFT_766816 [Mycena maculata]
MASFLWWYPARSASSYVPFQPPPSIAWLRPVLSVTSITVPPHPPLILAGDPNDSNFALNPQLAHHRSDLHPYLAWNVADSPLRACQRNGADTKPIAPEFHLAQYATLPPIKSLEIAFSGTAASRLEQWDVIHIERRDGSPLLVGDVLTRSISMSRGP